MESANMRSARSLRLIASKVDGDEKEKTTMAMYWDPIREIDRLTESMLDAARSPA
ncbi:hypothetical protein GCM10025870_07810 [Agromyces marinus]|uniref:Uncharacterized protein n=1 Tax=Agromyces marinus TaxID=1389020 RepID=A0ABN6YEA4_9MICO|nr:hypothetical protein GCM10025870_07810 [Agromyces marinus]